MYKKFISKNGEKLYCVCRWETNQHKIYNFYDKAMIRWYDEMSLESLENLENAEMAMKWIGNVKDDGFVYAPYEAYKLIRDIIGYYDMTH